MPDHTPPAAPTAAALPTTVRHIVLRRRPVGVPAPDCFALVETPMPVLDDGQMLVRMRVGSVDPAIRGFLDDRPSYLPPVAIGETVRGMALGEVIESRNPALPVGTLVRALSGWASHAILAPDALGLEAVERAEGVPLEAYMGLLGPSGLTAWVGLHIIGAARPGDTVLVSAAAGAVGSVVCQLARDIGCTVVALAGSEAKCAQLRALGIEAAVNYRAAADLAEALRTAAPQGFDVYFDNVGGQTLETVLPLMREQGRVVVCGMIADYNDQDDPYPVRTLWQLVVKRLTMRGFLTYDHAEHLGRASRELVEGVAAGRLVPLHSAYDGLSEAPRAFIDLMSGKTTGKTLVRLP